MQALSFLACIRQVPYRNFGSVLMVVGVSLIFSKRVPGYYCLLGHDHFLSLLFQFPFTHYFEAIYSELADISKSYTKYS